MAPEMVTIAATTEQTQKSVESRNAEGLLIPAGTAITIVLAAAGLFAGLAALI